MNIFYSVHLKKMPSISTPHSNFPPLGFVRVTEGNANHVYVNTSELLVLKAYTNHRYFQSELAALTSKFVLRPRLLEHGLHDKTPFVLMSLIGNPICRFEIEEKLQLAATLASLHHTSVKLPIVRATTRFAWLCSYAPTVEACTGIVVSTFLSRIDQHLLGGSQAICFTHGDLMVANIRNHEAGLHLIDFDEAGLFPASFDFAKIFWSDLPGLQTLHDLERFAQMYREQGGFEIRFDNAMIDFIILAGLDTWLWRVAHFPGSAFEREIECRLLSFCAEHGFVPK